MMQRNHHRLLCKGTVQAHVSPEHSPKFMLFKELSKMKAKCSRASATSSSQDPSLSYSCPRFCTQLKPSYRQQSGQKGHRSQSA